MKKLYFALAFLGITLFTSESLQAQYYSTAVGLRLGYPVSASVKHFLGNSGNALEGYVGFRGLGFNSGFGVSAHGAYLIHKDIDEVDGLQWYYGGGAGVYFWNYRGITFGDGASSMSIALQGYGGLEYTFDGAPIAITLDWVPSFFFLNGFTTGFGVGYGGLGVRYTLGY